MMYSVLIAGECQELPLFALHKDNLVGANTVSRTHNNQTRKNGKLCIWKLCKPGNVLTTL